MDVFLTHPGIAIAVDSPGIPMNLFVGNWKGYTGYKSILTSFAVHMKGGVRYMHTLRDMIYVYTFGERMAPITISGVSFAAVCENLKDRVATTSHGLEYAMSYYWTQRVTATGLPIRLVLGLAAIFQGFLDEGTFQLADPNSYVGQFSFNFNAIQMGR
jgi:hypothetical protein